MASLATDTTISSSVLNNQQSFAYQFYRKYLWKELSENGEQESGWILRTIYRQFGNWCVRKNYCVDGTDKITKLFWFKQIVSFLCYEDPCVAVLRGHTNDVSSVAKLNETTIISGSSDNTVRVWDLGSKSCVEVLRGHTMSVHSVAKFNETTIISGSKDNTVRVWDLDIARENKIKREQAAQTKK